MYIIFSKWLQFEFNYFFLSFIIFFLLRMCCAKPEIFEDFLFQVYLIAVNCLCPFRRHRRQFYDAFGRWRFRGNFCSHFPSRKWGGLDGCCFFLFNLIQEGRFRAFFALRCLYYLSFSPCFVL